jgi:hypothetical protein
VDSGKLEAARLLAEQLVKFREFGQLKRLKVLGFLLGISVALAGSALAQAGATGRRPLDARQQYLLNRPLDMHRLYQIVGYFYDLDPGLLESIASVESKGNPHAVSPKGAQGVMQLIPETSRRFRVSDPFDPVENVLGAARFLSQLRSGEEFQVPFEVHLPEMLAAYNAGPGAVEKYGGIPPYAETKDYVRKVLWTYLLGGVPRNLKPAAASPGRAKARNLNPAAASPGPARAGSRDGAVLHQLADIGRKRELARTREAETRAALNIRQ